VVLELLVEMLSAEWLACLTRRHSRVGRAGKLDDGESDREIVVDLMPVCTETSDRQISRTPAPARAGQQEALGTAEPRIGEVAVVNLCW